MFTRTALPPQYGWRALPTVSAPMNAHILIHRGEQILLPTQRPINAPATDSTGLWGYVGYADYRPNPVHFGRAGAGPALRMKYGIPSAPPRRKGR